MTDPRSPRPRTPSPPSPALCAGCPAWSHAPKACLVSTVVGGEGCHMFKELYEARVQRDSSDLRWPT